MPAAHGHANIVQQFRVARLRSQSTGNLSGPFPLCTARVGTSRCPVERQLTYLSLISDAAVLSPHGAHAALKLLHAETHANTSLWATLTDVLSSRIKAADPLKTDELLAYQAHDPVSYSQFVAVNHRLDEELAALIVKRYLLDPANDAGETVRLSSSEIKFLL